MPPKKKAVAAAAAKKVAVKKKVGRPRKSKVDEFPKMTAEQRTALEHWVSGGTIYESLALSIPFQHLCHAFPLLKRLDALKRIKKDDVHIGFSAYELAMTSLVLCKERRIAFRDTDIGGRDALEVGMRLLEASEREIEKRYRWITPNDYISLTERLFVGRSVGLVSIGEASDILFSGREIAIEEVRITNKHEKVEALARIAGEAFKLNKEGEHLMTCHDVASLILFACRHEEIFRWPKKTSPK